MDIKIIAVEQVTKTGKTGKPYQVLEATFKNLTFGKTESKTIMSFGSQKSAYEILSLAQSGEEYSVEVKKNDAGYNDWVSVTKGAGTNQGAQRAPSAAPVAATAGTAAPTNVKSSSTYATAEERAKIQIYIVRQSSLSAAINTLAAKPGTPLNPEDVIKVARQYEDFVFGTEPEDVGETPDYSGGIADMSDDVPY